jgi:two-component system response regulator HydG
MRVLMIGNDLNYLRFLGKKLSDHAMVPRHCGSLDEAKDCLKKEAFDTIICCTPLLNKSCPFELLTLLKESAPHVAIIYISDNLQLHTAMELMRQGLYSCFNRPFPIEQLIDVLEQMPSEGQELAAAKAVERAEKKESERIVLSQKHLIKGISAIANDMYEKISLVGPTNFSVIVYGETGTGKESVARRVANYNPNPEPYIAVDCGCLSKELALSELFGHEKGSFTGAMARKIGAFELANNGTLFLDEIGNLDYEVQGYLLRALQERKIRRIGGAEDINVNIRIVVASNENLANAVKEGKFREDLYHRLNEFEITVPPLRVRKEDIPLFIQQFIKDTNEELDKEVLFPNEETLQKITQYNWPGNIRELKNAIRRACLLCPDGKAININHLPKEVATGDIIIWEKKEENPQSIMQRKKPREITLVEIDNAMKLNNYNKTKAAHYLGIDRKTLYNRLKGVM